MFANRGEYDRYVWRTEEARLPDLESFYSSRTNWVAALLSQPPGSKTRENEGQSDLMAKGLSVSLKTAKGYVGEPRTAALEWAVHEAAHQLAFNSGLQKRGVMYPFWVAATLGPLDELEAGWQALLNELEADSQKGGSLVVQLPPSRNPTPLAELDKDKDPTQEFDQHGD